MMFTGIIQETGTVLNITDEEMAASITIQADRVLADVKLGDSIAVNGVCLTVTDFTPTEFSAFVMGETLRRTGFSSLIAGDTVNLEPAMKADDRFGGHFVSGHIDGKGVIESITAEGQATWISIKAGPEQAKYLVEKGSVAVDGVSLTVAAVNGEEFKISLIPHSGTNTNLNQKKEGDTVNIECDLLGKYVEKLLRRTEIEEAGETGGINMEYLAENGFC